jgi:2-polyprenyl-3-methyl-5-hydroxy-6-metoxy-1,4-benzoquinol methylase
MRYLKDYIERRTSCLTGSKDFISIAKVEEFPVFFGVTDKPEKDDLYAVMEWFLEKETGLIQLNKLIPLDVLYQEQHAYGFGETWENHYSKFSDFLCQIKHSNVLEIGAGQGRIAQICASSDDVKKWTIIEPNPTFEETEKIKVITGFFDREFNIDSEFDTYTFSHVLEHAYDPKDFLVCIYEKMRISDNLIFSYPNLKAWLEKKFTNSLNFEHTIFLTVEHLETLLKNVGFTIVRRTDYLDHSHFFHVQKGLVPSISIEYSNNSEENEQLLKDFIKYHIDEVVVLNRKLNDISNKSVYLFGAHIFSQYLKVFGLNTNSIVSVLDNSKQKEGKRLYGTSLFVQNPEVLRDVENPVVILRAGPYNEEIKSQILSTINAQTIFI